jgi:hypothetical protein
VRLKSYQLSSYQTRPRNRLDKALHLQLQAFYSPTSDSECKTSCVERPTTGLLSRISPGSTHFSQSKNFLSAYPMHRCCPTARTASPAILLSHVDPACNRPQEVDRHRLAMTTTGELQPHCSLKRIYLGDAYLLPFDLNQSNFRLALLRTRSCEFSFLL